MEQLALVLAERCASRAERTGWDRAGAEQCILRLLKTGPMSGEDLVEACEAHGYRGHDARCFGAVFGSLSRRKAIVCLRADLPRRNGHGTSGGRLWGLTTPPGSANPD